MSTINFNKYIKNNQVLDLSGKWGIFCNSGYEERVKDLGEFIKNNPNITTLNLSNSYIKVDSLHSLVDSINNSNITTLNISSNNLGPKGAEAIAKMKLHNLDIALNNLGPEGAEALSKMNLTSLNISSNNLGPDGAEALSKMLNNLNRLNIATNNIGPEGAKAIAKMLNNLNNLNISSNYLGPKGAKYISELPNLTSLDIALNNLGPEGVEALSKMLNNLNRLNISANDLGPEGAKAIAKMKINSLNIAFNNLGPEGAEALSKMFNNLTSLDISGNQLGPKGAEELGKLTNCSFEGDDLITVFCSLLQQKNRDPNITPEEIQNDIFQLVSSRNDKGVEYLLNKGFPVLINSPDPHGTSIGHFYPDLPAIQQLLFHKGLIPAPVLQRGSIGNVTADRQGVHLTEVVDPINFTVAELIEFYGQDEKQVSAAVKSFQNKLAGFNPNSLKVSLLSLTEGGKKLL